MIAQQDQHVVYLRNQKFIVVPINKIFITYLWDDVLHCPIWAKLFSEALHIIGSRIPNGVDLKIKYPTFSTLITKKQTIYPLQWSCIVHLLEKKSCVNNAQNFTKPQLQNCICK